MNFGNKNETNSGKRKRIKLECLECGKTFDNDNLRSSIVDDRLDSLMILSVEKDVVDQLDMNKIATLWETLKNRRINI
ncbi:unnamed protein product [Macrosiphum euphorbiae]|uniref:Uncharacterized protein n=1 Tax=Macrosiphum euphorbiae TaxID=13131 RepID=A0AAV0WPT6_9HEMI|nr:unnamed protein product [Macrosiphum euphorbiae]